MNFGEKGMYDDALKSIMTKWKSEGVDSFLSERNGDITLHQIVIAKENRGKGLGTEKIKELQSFAQKNQLRIILTPDKSLGGSSKGRLEKFYRGLGFVKNSGRNKDYRINESYIWRPTKLNEWWVI